MKADYDDRDAPPDVPAPTLEERAKAMNRTPAEVQMAEGTLHVPAGPVWGTAEHIRGAAAIEFERRQRGEVRQTGPWAPDVPLFTAAEGKARHNYTLGEIADKVADIAEKKLSLRDAVASGGTYTPPAFISLGGGVHAKRDAILATYANEAGGTIALFVGGNYINGPRPHAEFVKELLEGAP